MTAIDLYSLGHETDWFQKSIFDEFYSVKFPGPRIAVGEFCEDRQIVSTFLRSDGPIERWELCR